MPRLAVTSFSATRSLVIVSLVFHAALAHAADARGLCDKDERTLFTCPIGKNVASVCASTTLSTEEGYVQYRFGRTGQLQLVFPLEKAHPRSHFRLSHEAAAKWANTQVGFAIDGYTYVVHEYASAGVLVSNPSGEKRNLACRPSGTHTGLQELVPLQLEELPKVFRFQTSQTSHSPLGAP
jgi:hypothetical protein